MTKEHSLSLIFLSANMLRQLLPDHFIVYFNHTDSDRVRPVYTSHSCLGKELR